MDGYQISFQFQIGLVRDRLVVDSASLNLKARPCFYQIILTVKFTFQNFRYVLRIEIVTDQIYQKLGRIKGVSTKCSGKLIVAASFCLLS